MTDTLPHTGEFDALTAADAELPTIVIGGGPAGLTAGYLLAKRGKPVIVFEAEDRNLRELEELAERERGFYHGHFETLKSTTFARSLYIALRTAEFGTLIPWRT